MKIGKMSKTIMICVSLLTMSIPCLAKSAPVAGQPEQTEQKNQQADATIIQIDKNNVTLQGIADKEKKITAPFINAAEFKVGDKVIVTGDTLKKI